MKRPLQLSLAIALALGGSDALALGLGTIHVHSKLNQPLDADIPVIEGNAKEAEGLVVQLASAEDFDRVGLSRSRLTVPIQFSVGKDGAGKPVIKVTSSDIIREPFLDFLIEANWPKGRLLREYTVLLDPPVMAPASGSAVTSAAAKAPERAPVESLPEPKPKTTPKPNRAPPVAEPSSAPSTAASAPRHGVNGDQYGPVESGQTLSGIAREVRADESGNLDQLMLALLKANPQAFYKDNINALKRGAILRIPSADEVKAVGSASQAASEVRSQIEDWRGAAASTPTLVAETGAGATTSESPTTTKKSGKTSTAGASTTKPNEHLELVPPKAGQGSVAMADRPGSGAASNTMVADLKSDLARTKEALASREQESSELKSRVKELEDTKSKSDRLLSLKDSEIADLQKKLKALQDQEAKGGAKSATTETASTKTPSTSTPAPPAGGGESVSKEDIWGKAAPPSGQTKPAASATGSPTSPPTSPGENATPPAPTSTPGATTPPSATGTTPPTGENAAATTATGGAEAAPSTTTPSTTTPSTTTTMPNASPSTSPTTPTSTPPAHPPVKKAATTTPVKKTPAMPTMAWYEQPWVKPAAVGAGALVLLLALLGLRRSRKKPVAATGGRGSIAGAFGDSPIASSPEGAAAAASADEEENALREQLDNEPDNAGLHLELLSLLYAERRVEAFEQAAEDMHRHITDPHQPEWLEARAMGQELAPHHPLFADEAGHDAYDDDAVTQPHQPLPPSDPFDDDFEDSFARAPAEEMPEPPAAAPAFGLDLGEQPPAPPPATPKSDEPAFQFDDLPPIDYGNEAVPPADFGHEAVPPVAEPAAEPAPLEVEDEFATEDGVGTKLDLAKAYLDMGDPEGARSMLEEVMNEGNEQQKAEAGRLMGEIR